ncbi:competence/damage-inducible protein A [Acidobacteria bacterium AH-259-L09]|nr:competence/damage-inducible protein A [Acidobacteria bacterium AH-259-L09]
MRAEIIAVGSELLTSARVETNSLFIAEKLSQCGIRVMRKFVVGDREAEIRGALRAALKDAEILIFTGGLGPTNDDITREVVSETLRRSLSLHSAILEDLKARYQRFGLRMTENNQRQAMVPEGAEPIDNTHGTAPGLFLKEGKALIFLLPGPPHELKPMMTNRVMDLIHKYKQTSRQFYRRLKVASEAESRVDFRIGSTYKSYPSIETTILASPGIIELFFCWVGEVNEQLAEQQLEELTRRVRDKLSESVFTDQELDLQEVIGQILRDSGKTLATAESCTGGLIGKMLTDVPGSSDYYRGGLVCYSDDLKVDLLGVNATTIERFGAVSEQVAYQMAVEIRKRARADLGLSVTGIAGPNGGTPEKPVGLVFVGLSSEQETGVKKLQFPGQRETIRLRASRFALDCVRRSLL